MTFHMHHTLENENPEIQRPLRGEIPRATNPMRIAIVTGSVPTDSMGGAEYQSMLLATELVKRGHDVAFIATRASIDEETTVDALRVIRITSQQRDASPLLQEKLHDRMTQFSPDVCYVRRFLSLPEVARVCKRIGTPLISASSAGFETSPFQFSRSPRAIARQYQSFQAIKFAEVHCCNTLLLQSKVLRWLPDANVRTIYNGQQVPDLERKDPRSTGQIVWVNNLKRWKRPEVIVELARRLPQYRFVMIGRMASGRYGRQIERLFCDAPTNCQYVGPLPVEEVNQRIAESDLLMYTSRPLEGFGNSFIQAWFRYVPTVTLSVEVDGIIQRERLGRCCQTVDELAETVGELMEDEFARFQMGQRARNFAVENLSQDIMVSNYEALFADVLQRHDHSQRQNPV